MKNIKSILSVLLSVVFVSCSSTKVPVPEYISDCHEYYDEGIYLSAVGEGKTLEEARIAAAVEISRYIQTEIDSNVKIEMFYKETDGKINLNESSSSVNSSKSNFIFTGLEYSEVYKPKKTYYIAAYIEKAKAYNQVNVETKILMNEFLELYSAAEKEDPLSAVSDFSKAKQFTPALIEKINILTAIDSGRAADEYAECTKKISLLETKKNESLKKSAVQIQKIDEDYENIIYSQVEASLKNAGLGVSKGAAAYKANVTVDLNKVTEGDGELLVARPSAEIEILYKDETVYTITVSVDEKTLAYGMDKLRRESLKKLAKKIAADFGKDFSAR
ncbi:hypothetical protein HNP77_001198 [Treponema rectale]|uniref:LPP20 lipoprotein n=1 Tax=Treponema rectale TaxID=744512 RepID=A0A840S885_9SPIR|nr:LPP20 family lipoprotein [Treponema rectale]MBB5218829.1 hypothetical protein [Treponema rectale]